jgi:hypothetical protein
MVSDLKPTRFGHVVWELRFVSNLEFMIWDVNGEKGGPSDPKHS